MVSDTFRCTGKCLLGLALAVPCITYDGVKESIKQVRRRGVGGKGGNKERRGDPKLDHTKLPISEDAQSSKSGTSIFR